MNDDPFEGSESRDMREFFTDEELNFLEQQWHEHGQDPMAMMDALKSWFHEPERAARLEANGMLPTYASYAIPFFLDKVLRQKQAAESDDIVDRIMGNRKPPGDPSLN